MKHKTIISLAIILISTSLLFAQSSTWKLSWDANPESDNVVTYKIFRSNSPQPSNLHASVSHPNNVFEDANLEPGIIYYYRLKAVNADGNESPFSAQVYEAIPLISDFPSEREVSSGSNIQVALDQYVNDPTNDDSELVWEITSSLQNIQASINSERILNISAPSGWTGQEQIDLRVADPNDFFDQTTLNVNVTEEATDTQAPQTVANVAISFPGRSTSGKQCRLTWDANSEPDVVTYQIYRSQSPEPTDLLATVDHPNNSYRDTGLVKGVIYYYRLKAVDAAGNESSYSQQVSEAIPKIKNLPSIWELESGDNQQIYLDQYVDDPNDSDVQLSWEIGSGLQNVQASLNSERVLTLSAPADWAGQEQFDLTVQDPKGFYDQINIRVSVTDTNQEGEDGNTENLQIENSISVYFSQGFTSGQISYTTNQPSRDFVEYGLDQTYEIKTNQDPSFTTQHFYPLGNLEPNELYYFRIISVDQNGQIHFLADSVFSTGEILAEEAIIVYPVPFRAQDEQHSDGIVFSNLTEGSTISVFDLLGDKVFSETTESRIYRWDTNNPSGNAVRSGLYLYIVQNAENKKVASGKLIIVR